MIQYVHDAMISTYHSQTKNVLLKGIEYNSSTKGKCENTNEIVTTGSTENCESENDKKVSFDNVTNVG